MGCNWLKACHDKKNELYFCDIMEKEACYFDYSAVGVCESFLVKEDGCKMVVAYSNMVCSDQDVSKET